MSDDAFLRAILDDPGNDTTRLVYADWLDDQGDAGSAARAEFLRLTVQQAGATGRKREKKARQKRLQQLAAELDTDWLAVVSRLPIENCAGKREGQGRRRIPVRFDFLCDRRWEELRTTDNRAVRFCGACRQNVHYCDTIMEARQHAQDGHCVAVDLGIIRREGDLEPQRMWMGRIRPETLQRERNRVKPDPVSAARESRKRLKSS
jgi:uncharacterized protein (TIGR02996 family)